MAYQLYSRMNQRILDGAVGATSLYLAYLIRYDGTILPYYRYQFLALLMPMIAGRLVVGMRSVSIVAALVGAGIALVGFDLAYRLDWPTGPTDVALAGMVLALVTAGRIMRTLVLQPAVK